jgi:acetyl-CoA/propionyl-CoA carboxylase biotin carboxyl carrier protein
VARAEGAADDAAATPAGDPFATSPMTGVVAKVHAAPGAAVGRGAALFAVEAMKMEYVVRADRDVVVDEVRARPGDRVEVGAVVVTFRDPGEGATP